MFFLSTPPQFLPTSEIFLLFKVKMMQKTDVSEIFYQNHKRNWHPLRLLPIKNAPFWRNEALINSRLGFNPT
jgi:hypothetical protein